MKNRYGLLILLSLAFFVTINAHSYWIYNDVSEGVDGEPIEVELVEGWNLISCPYEGWKVPSEFDCFGWNGQNYFSHDKNTPLEAGKGYWLYSSRDCLVTMSGIEVDQPFHALEKGWNLIGPYTLTFTVFVNIHTAYSWKGAYNVEYLLNPGFGYWCFCVEPYDPEIRLVIEDCLADSTKNILTVDINISTKYPDYVQVYLYDIDNNKVALSPVTFSNKGWPGPPSKRSLYFPKIEVTEEHGLSLFPNTQYLLQITPIYDGVAAKHETYRFTSGPLHVPDIQDAEFSWKSNSSSNIAHVSFGHRMEYVAYKMDRKGKILKEYHKLGSYDEDGEISLSEEIIDDLFMTKVENNKIVVMVRAVDDSDLPVTDWKTFSSDGISFLDLGYKYVEIDISSGSDSDIYPASLQIDRSTLDGEYFSTHILFVVSAEPRTTQEEMVNLKFDVGHETYYTVFPITNEQRNSVLGENGGIGTKFMELLSSRTKINFETFSNISHDEVPEDIPPSLVEISSGDSPDDDYLEGPGYEWWGPGGGGGYWIYTTD